MNKSISLMRCIGKDDTNLENATKSKEDQQTTSSATNICFASSTWKIHFPYCKVTPHIWGQKINTNFFCAKFLEYPSGHGSPRRKSWTSAPKGVFSCGLMMGRNSLSPGHLGVRVRNVRAKSGLKCLCLCCFYSLNTSSQLCSIHLRCQLNIEETHAYCQVKATHTARSAQYHQIVKRLLCSRTS